MRLWACRWAGVFLLAVGPVSAQNAPAPAAGNTAPAGAPERIFHLLNLSNFYAVRFADLPPSDVWQAVPLGRQSIDGVPFQVEGRVDVTGMMAARMGDFAPTRIAGIPVGRKAHRLFLVHGAAGMERDGVPIAKLVLHFQGGETRDLRIAYGLHVLNCFDSSDEPKPVDDPGSHVAWERKNDLGRSDPALRLYQTVFENSLPDERIESIDVVSLFSRATPFLVALTLEEDGAASALPERRGRVARRALEWRDDVYRRSLLVHAVAAADGRPLTNATAFLTLTDDQASFYFGSAQADTQGRLVLEYPPQQTVAFSVLVKSPGLVPAITSQSRTQLVAAFPEEFTVKLARGATAGGIVKTATGEPIAGAEIAVSKVTRDASRKYVQLDYDTVATDAAGKWTTSALPEDFSGFLFTATHPLFQPVQYGQAGETNAGTNALTATAGSPGAAPSCVPPPAGLTGWWSGDGHIRNLVGTNSATRRPGVAYVRGKVDRAWSFNGVNGAIQVAASANLNVGTGAGMTIEAWVQPRNLTRRGPLVEWNSGTGARPWGVHLYILAPNEFALGAGNLYANLVDTAGASHELKAPGGTMTTGAFQHVALTYDKESGLGCLYHNGRIVTQQKFGACTPQTSYNLFFGARPFGDLVTTFSGAIDEAAIYNRALSVAEIGSIVKAGAAGKCKPAGSPALAGTSPTVIPILTTSNLLAGQAVMVMAPAIRLAGIVTDDQGTPVPKADVYFFDAPEKRDFARRMAADEQGQFAFTCPEAGAGALAVLARGFAPKYTPTQIGEDTNRIVVSLRKSQRATGLVREQDSQPIGGATVRLDSWHNNQLVRWQTRTDADGRFVWDNPPEDQVMLYLTASNYYSTRYSMVVGPGGSLTMTLSRPMMAFGKVVDAETKKPLEEFAAIQGYRYMYSSYDPVRWQRYNAQRGRGGEYSMRLNNYGSATNWILIEAKGYLPAVSPPFFRGGWVTNHFEMKKGKGPAGIVQFANGEPAANGTVVLAETGDSPYMNREAQLRQSGSGNADFARTDRQGHFEFAPKLNQRRIFAAHDQGYAEIAVDELLKTGKIILQPWGSVKGLLRVGPGGWSNQTVVAQSEYDRYDGGYQREPRLSVFINTLTGDAGEFLFPRLPPGWRRVAYQYPKVRGPDDDGSTPLSHATPVLVKPGETNEVTLGGTGRIVTGRMAVSGGQASDVNWQRDVHTLNSRLPPLTNIQPPRVTGAMSPAEQQKLWADYQQRQREFWASEEGRTLNRQARSYVLLFDTNGGFRIEDVPPGGYDLSIFLNEREPYEGGGYSIRTIGSLNQPLEIPPAAAGQSDAPFDVGSLAIQIRRPLKIGQQAPALDTPALNGTVVRLADFRGTNVLLYFCTPQGGQNNFELQTLKSLHQSYAANGRVAIISLHVADSAKTVEEFAKTNDLKWIQCHLGQWSDTQVPARFGVEGLPEGILIGPDGRVLAKDLRGSMLGTAVRNRLAAPGR